MSDAKSWKYNRDYYTEKTFQIITEEYLLNRGYCCNSGCRNCPYKNENKTGPRVVSLVPSLTETLIHAGVNVVGRTRFCIHPHDIVKNIPIVGGTKNIDFEFLTQLKPDYVLLDKEENTLETYVKINFEKLVTHVTSIKSLQLELNNLSKILTAPKLKNFSERFEIILNSKPKTNRHLTDIVTWWRNTGGSADLNTLVYIIWKNPWMCIGSNTFIESVFKRLSPEYCLWTNNSLEKYPSFNIENLPSNSTLIFSTEPYNFEIKKTELMDLFPHHRLALANGEHFSWYGIRSLRFLEDQLEIDCK